ncbi:hypothetical protein AALA22_08970 [Anaerovoracaceae bacterium 41-7]
MIMITKDEAAYLRDHAKNVHVTVTGRGKNKRQKKRYADESIETFKLLRKFHNKAKNRGGVHES